MSTKFKTMLQVLVCAALALQAGGCIFVDRDHPRHYNPPPPYHHDDAAIDVHVH